MPRVFRRLSPGPKRTSPTLTLINVAVLLLLLVGILLFKKIVADRTAELVDELAPAEGSGETVDPERIELADDVAANLVHQASRRAAEAQRLGTGEGSSERR